MVVEAMYWNLNFIKNETINRILIVKTIKHKNFCFKNIFCKFCSVKFCSEIKFAVTCLISINTYHKIKQLRIILNKTTTNQGKYNLTTTK